MMPFKGRSLTLAVAVAAGAVTVLVSAAPFLRFAYRSPSLHVAMETAATLVALLTAFLVYGRFQQSRGRADLLLVCSLVLFAGVNLGLGAIPLALADGQREPLTVWAALGGRLASAAVVAVAAFIGVMLGLVPVYEHSRRRRMMIMEVVPHEEHSEPQPDDVTAEAGG